MFEQIAIITLYVYLFPYGKYDVMCLHRFQVSRCLSMREHMVNVIFEFRQMTNITLRV